MHLYVRFVVFVWPTWEPRVLRERMKGEKSYELIVFRYDGSRHCRRSIHRSQVVHTAGYINFSKADTKYRPLENAFELKQIFINDDCLILFQPFCTSSTVWQLSLVCEKKRIVPGCISVLFFFSRCFTLYTLLLSVHQNNFCGFFFCIGYSSSYCLLSFHC